MSGFESRAALYGLQGTLAQQGRRGGERRGPRLDMAGGPFVLRRTAGGPLAPAAADLNSHCPQNFWLGPKQNRVGMADSECVPMYAGARRRGQWRRAPVRQ